MTVVEKKVNVKSTDMTKEMADEAVDAARQVSAAHPNAAPYTCPARAVVVAITIVLPLAS
jgi:hypothetical protein